jgi:hypothetical protein
VKNLLDLKNAQRVLIDGNIMEDSWDGFTQVGFAMLLTPKNQRGSNGTNLCPVCQVTDVTIRYDSISHVAAGLQIGNALAGTGAPLDGQRYSIHDIVIDDIDEVKYSGPGVFAQVSVGAGAPLLQNVTINHVTAFPHLSCSSSAYGGNQHADEKLRFHQQHSERRHKPSMVHWRRPDQLCLLRQTINNVQCLLQPLLVRQ